MVKRKIIQKFFYLIVQTIIKLLPEKVEKGNQGKKKKFRYSCKTIKEWAKCSSKRTPKGKAEKENHKCRGLLPSNSFLIKIPF